MQVVVHADATGAPLCLKFTVPDRWMRAPLSRLAHAFAKHARASNHPLGDGAIGLRESGRARPHAPELIAADQRPAFLLVKIDIEGAGAMALGLLDIGSVA